MCNEKSGLIESLQYTATKEEREDVS